MRNLASIVLPVAILGVLAATLVGCSASSPPLPVPEATPATTQPTDYATPAHWLSLPTTGTMPVDVFYLYPTSYEKENASAPNISAVDDPGMMKGAQAAFGRQATAFETLANVFAPYYRQADASYILSLPQAEQDKVVGGVPASDALAAFKYYLEHYNGGRPYILAGHSQGSNVLLFLLSDFMKQNPEVYKRMVAAYVIGYSVTPDYLARNPHLKFAKGPDDTGVIVSYNTEAPEIGGKNPVVLPGALVINPITWTTTEITATATQNLGSILLNKDGTAMVGADGKPVRVKDLADARIDTSKGVVICSTAPVDELAPGTALFPRGVYHKFDYPFYYFDIRANAANRIKSYMAHQTLIP